MNDVNNDLSEYLIELNREVLDANVNLQYFEHVVNIIDDISSNESSDDLPAKSKGRDFTLAQKTIKKLSELLRNFNDDVETVFHDFGNIFGLSTANKVNAMLTSAKLLMSTASLSPAPGTNLLPIPLSAPSPPSISQSIESVYSFTSDVWNYRCGVFGTCEITHIIDSVECICCMVDFERNVSSELFEQRLSESIPMNGLPAFNEIFGIEINSQIVRATCEKHIEIDKSNVPIQLIDIGKVTHVKSLSDHKIYNLTHEAKLTPKRANLCKIEKIGSKHTDIVLDETILMRKFHFKVIEVCHDKRMLTVELFLTNPFVGEYNDVLTEHHRQHQQQREQQEQLHSSLSSSIGNENALTQKERMATMESALSSSLSGNYDNDITIASVPRIQRRQVHEMQKRNRKAFDAKIESMETVFVENTISNANCNAGNTKRSNATVNAEHRRNDVVLPCVSQSCNGNELVAVAGNTTNPTENGALIRASQHIFSQNKKQKKIPIDNNIDAAMHKLFAKSNDLVVDNNNNNYSRYECRALSPMQMPPTMIQSVDVNTYERILDNHLVGETVTIFPTCIVSVEQFYARLGAHHHSFNNFHVKLNAEMEANKLKRYSLNPEPMEMVLVLLYDGTLHRAKVLNNLPTAENRFEVFCLDSGLTRFASLDNIFHWSPLCCLIPFQAVVCNIVNVRSRRENDVEAIEFMSRMLLHRPVLAEVKNINTCGLFVRILYDDGFDIAEDVLIRNLATR